MAPLASPSPGSRTQFPAPQVKVARMHAPQSPGSTGPFPHPTLPPPLSQPPGNRQDMLVPARPTTLTLPRGAPTAVVRQGVTTPEQFGASRLPFPTGSQPQSPFSPQPPQSPHEQFPQSPVSLTPTPQVTTPQVDLFQRQQSETATSDPYAQPPNTPRPQFLSSGPQTQRSPVYVSTQFAQAPAAPRPQFSAPVTRPTPQVVYAATRIQQQGQQDPYASQPPTPRPAPSDPFVQQIGTPRPQDPYATQPQTPRAQQLDPYSQQPTTPRPRPEGEVYTQQQSQQGPEVTRQLRDLLQRQHFTKKLDQDSVVQGQPRLWTQGKVP